jgi:tRNA-splicing ligase RtcB (3'-phosphate/5'-hydroxy nucleic acid ligase)
MIELKGKYNTAKVFTDNVEDSASSQIINLLNQDFIVGSKVRIMPDVHAGAGCVIGFTADLGEKVIANLVGVDLGCGVLCVELGKEKIDLNKLDNIVHYFIPSGHNIHDKKVTEFGKIKEIYCIDKLKNVSKFENAIGTLGGGNHMIEVDVDEDGTNYLIIHSGSRNFGKQVADYYQNLAIDTLSGKANLSKQKEMLIREYKILNRQSEIKKDLADLQEKYNKLQPLYPKELCFLIEDNREEYLHDMRICQEYASLNRATMSDIILEKLFGTNDNFGVFETIHNYINFDDNIIRKGAVSAYEGEKLIIPINMRDGSLLCTGKGNEDWNFSAPHGAGRLMSRSDAKRRLNLADFKNEMKEVFSTTVSQRTLDESPDAYKPMQEIIDNMQEAVIIDKIIKPVYNFKAGE